MLKWYENPAVDADIVISSRVRLARNLNDFLFPNRLGLPEAAEAVRLMRKSIFCEENRQMVDADSFNFLDLSSHSTWDLNILAERHIISPTMVKKGVQKGLVHSGCENVSVMFNEEDHIRIQSIFVGKDLDAAFKTADNLDDIMSRSLDYAFDHDIGYLTACPTNTGTGLRASYMLHLPLLEASGGLKMELTALNRAGIVVRGIYGEGSESHGSIYQISNQRTLGKSEEEIIIELKTYTDQLIEKENKLRGVMVMDYLTEGQDSFWRSHAILSNSRKISLPEAMRHLSEIRLGYMLGAILGYLDNPGVGTIYNLITNIQTYNLQKIMGPAGDARQLDILRADYLRRAFAG